MLNDEAIIIRRYQRVCEMLDCTARSSNNYHFLLGMKEAFEVALNAKTFEDIERLRHV